MCVCILDMKGARTRAKWLGGCISAEYTKGSLSLSWWLLLRRPGKSHFSANERGMLYTH